MAYNDLGLAADKIADIQRTAGTGQAGSLDTYTITTASGDTFQFQVQNGTNASVSVESNEFTDSSALNTFMLAHAEDVIAVIYATRNSALPSNPITNVRSAEFAINTTNATVTISTRDTAGTATTVTPSAQNPIIVISNGEGSQSVDTALDVNSANLVTNRAITGSLAKPAGVYDTVDALTLTYPSGNGNVYVIRADNKWYMWSGSAWVAGGDYKGLIDAENRVALFNDNPNDFITDHYVMKYNGNIVELSGVNVIKCFVKGAQKILYKYIVPRSDYRGLVFFDESGNYLIGYYTTSSEQEIVVPDGAYYVMASVKNKEDLIVVKNISSLFETISEKVGLYNDDLSYLYKNKYIVKTSGQMNDLNGVNVVKCYVKGAKKVIYKYTISVSDYRGIAFYDESGIMVGSEYTTQNVQIIDIPEKAVYCQATVINESDLVVIANINNILEAMAKLDNDFDVLSAFSNIVCLGDSLTYSQVYTSYNQARQAFKTYPQVLGIKTGANVVTYANPGANTSYIYGHFAELLEEKTNQLAIIYAGTNGGLTDTLDEDCPESEPNYNLWANTNTGNYGKLVMTCKSLNMKVLLIKVYAADGAGVDTTNSVIEQIGQRFGCAVVGPINLSDRKYHLYPAFNDWNSVHYNDMGYSAFADALIKMTSKLPMATLKYLIQN